MNRPKALGGFPKDPAETVVIDPTSIENEMERRRTDTLSYAKKTTSAFNDILLLLDELEPNERRRCARAIAIYYEVYR